MTAAPTICPRCGGPVATVAGRTVHVTPSRVGLGWRPTFVACPQPTDRSRRSLHRGLVRPPVQGPALPGPGPSACRAGQRTVSPGERGGARATGERPDVEVPAPTVGSQRPARAVSPAVRAAARTVRPPIQS